MPVTGMSHYPISTCRFSLVVSMHLWWGEVVEISREFIFDDHVLNSHDLSDCLNTDNYYMEKFVIEILLLKNQDQSTSHKLWNSPNCFLLFLLLLIIIIIIIIIVVVHFVLILTIDVKSHTFVPLSY